jgi:hypothetical protein
MKTKIAEQLVKVLNETSRPAVRVYIDGGAIVFSGTTGEHRLDIGASSFERVIAHWQGFTNRPAPMLVEGARVLFRRGMYGNFTGQIAHAGRTHQDEPYFLVRFHRVNGSKATRRIELRDIIRGFA